MSSSVILIIKKENISILGVGPTQRLNDTMLTAEARYLIISLKSNIKCYLSLHYSKGNCFLFINITKVCHFKAKDFKKKHPLCLRNISETFFANNVKKLVSNECVYGFSVDYSTFGTNISLSIST